jgi:hypothetical protein
LITPPKIPQFAAELSTAKSVNNFALQKRGLSNAR